MRNSNQVNQDKMKVINLPRKLIVIVNLFSSGLCSINCSFNCKSFWILMIIFKCLVSTIVSTTSTPFSWSLDEDKRFYLPTNYYPIYRNLRSHQVGLSSSSSNSHLLSSSSFSNYHSHPSSSSHGSSIHDARFDETSVDSEDETNYDDSNGADDVNDDDNSGNGGDVVNGQDEENDDSMMMMNEGVERDVIGLDGGESGNGLKEIIENSISNSENELIILSRGRGLPKGSITMSQESILSYIDRISRGDWCRFHGHVADDSIRNLPSTSSSSSSSSPSSGLPLSPSSSSSLYEIDSTNQITFSSKLQMPSGSVPSSVTSSASSHPKKQSIPSHPLVYASSPLHEIPPHSLRLKYNQTAARVDLLNAILHDYKSQTDNYRFLKKSFHHMIDLDKDIIHAKIIWLNEQNINTDISKLNQQSSSSLIPTSITINHNIKPTYYYTTTKRKRPLNTYTYLNINRTISPFEPWLDFQFKSIEQEKLFDQLLTQQYILRSQLSSFQQPIDLNNNNDNPKPSSANLPIPTNNNNNNNLSSSSSSSSSSSNNQNDHHNSNDNKKATNSNNLNSSSNTKKIMINNKNKSNMMSNNNSNKNDPNNNNDHSNNNNKCPKFTSWTNAYYSCDYKIWLFSYTSLIIMETADSCILRGIISVDIDINSIDINQCDYQPSFMTIMETIKSTLTTEPTTSSSSSSSLSATTTTTTTGTTSSTLSTESSINKPSSQSTSTSTINLITIPLIGTNKCHQPSSKCTFQPGHGWTKGGYECRCRDGYFAPSASFTKDKTKSSQSFNGTEVEKAWNEKLTNQGSVQYDMIYVCQKCQPGCDTCKDNSPCLSSYNWAFRISLLTFSVICIFLTTMLACYIYKYRKLKVFKVASPIFLCITLLGCAIMYLEMAAIFPVLTTAACIATKTTRHMGFCLTYSALLLKTWRVSLTYRVKSAHKLKLTDKQLLQWLFPILMIMAIYLGTWTISAPPQSIYIYDWNNLKFKICEYNWWDHSLAIMESCFLLWGVKVCYNVRNAESFFNEAKYICWAIYNISAVNVTMICIHLILLPKAGPDGKYFFGFIRTQLSTTTTIAFIFGPKFYRVIKGQGDAWDNRVRARGINASFSLNGVGLVHEETHDLYQENEELKEEIHKLATQIELMKLMQMEINNRHLKPKHLLASGHHHILPTVTITANPASTGSVTQSPIVKACYSRFEANDAPSPRISPAAELASERV